MEKTEPMGWRVWPTLADALRYYCGEIGKGDYEEAVRAFGKSVVDAALTSS